MIIEVDWIQFKSFVTSRSLSIQWVSINDNYWLKGFDGAFSLECIIPLDNTLSADTVDFETNFKANGNKSLPQQNQPFASKVLPNGKKLYKREHGIQASLSTGNNNIFFTIPYPWVKIIGIEIFGGEHLDYCDLMILDSSTGTYSGVANYQLNQFGYTVNVAAGEYEEENAYDADLYQGMQIKIVYNSQSAKTICINFNLSEVK
jgi:hypothetical protein